MTIKKSSLGYMATKTKLIRTPIMSEYNNIIGYWNKPVITMLACGTDRNVVMKNAIERLLNK